MSITNARSFLEKPGCGVTFALVLAVIMGASMFSTCTRADQMQGAVPTDQNAPAVITVGTKKVTYEVLERMAEAQAANQEQQIRQYMGDQYEGMMARDKIGIFARTAKQLAEGALIFSIAEDLGIKLDDESIRGALSGELNKSIEEFKQQLVQQGKLKANSTQAEIDKAFKDATQKTPTEILEAQKTELDSNLQDPAKRHELETFAAQVLVTKRLATEVLATEKEVEESYDTFKLKSITFGPKPGVTEEPKTLASKVKGQVEKGMKFEDAMTKYSTAIVPPGKKLTELTNEVTRAQLLADPKTAPLVNLKSGMTSDVIESPAGVQLFKLYEINRKLPADYKTRKTFYRDQYIQTAARLRGLELMDEKKKAGLIVWDDAGLSSMVRILEIIEGGPVVPADLDKKLNEELQKLETEKEKAAPRNYANAKFMAMDRIFNTTPAEGRGKLREKYVEALQGVLEYTEDAGLRLSLVEQLLALKSKSVGEQLLLAAKSNLTYGPMGQRNHSEVYSFITKLKAEKLLDPAVETSLNSEQQRWIKDKKEMDAAIAQAKKQAEEERKKADAERKKAEAEAAEAKKKEGEKKESGAASSSDLIKPKN